MHHSESIILSKKPLREADLLVTFFSREDGKLKGVARHAKKSKKRFGSVLETGYVVDLHFKRSTGSDLVTINEAQLVEPLVYREIDLPRTAAIWLAAETVSRFLPDNEASHEKFELVKRFLAAIHEGRLTRQIVIYFMMKWISLCGYLPDLEHCIRCDEASESFHSFSPSLGGLICQRCSSDASLGYAFESGSVDALKRIISGSLDGPLTDKIYEDLLRFIFHYSMVLLGKPLKIEGYLPMLTEL